jgi:hypothetical protein
MGSKFLGLVVFLIMILILFNEIINLTKFIVNYHNIKEITKLSRSFCDTIYTEAETERFQISKNLYTLLLPNDVYNCKLYIILLFIFVIMFFVYISYDFFCMIYDQKYNLKYKDIFTFIIILYFIVSVILLIVFRYVPYDEAGYQNYFNKGADTIFNIPGLSKDAYNYNLFNLLIFILLVYALINQFVVSSDIDFFTYVFYSMYYIFGMYVLINMANIIATFKNNKIPYEIDEDKEKNNDINWTADISYESENYFYYKYLNYIDFDLMSDSNENNYSYTIHETFRPRIKTFMLMTFYFIVIILVLCVCIFVYAYMFDIEKLNEYVNTILQIFSMFSPIILLFLLIFYIMNNVFLNTAFNKDVLFNTSTVYKYDLNKLNNIVTPYISIYNNLITSKDDSDKEYNYVYNMLIFNVMVSYLRNNINMFTNDINKEYITTGNFYISSDEINNRNLVFDKINVLDINKIQTLELYYKHAMNNIFPDYVNEDGSMMSETDINKFISQCKLLFKDMVPTDKSLVTHEIGSKSYLIPEECFDDIYLKENKYTDLIYNKLIYLNYMSYVYDTDDKNIIDYKIQCLNTNKTPYHYKIVDDKIVDIQTIKIDDSYTDDLKKFLIHFLANNMIYSIYKLFEIFHIDTYNNKIELYNKIINDDQSERNKLLNDLIFVKPDSETINIKPYKFVLQKAYKKQDISVASLTNFDLHYRVELMSILKAYHENMLSLYLHILIYEQKLDPKDKRKFLFEQIQPYFKALYDRQTEGKIKYNIYYIYCLVASDFKIFVEGKDNYLQNVIENNFYKINNQQMQVVSMNTNTFLQNDDDTIHKDNQMTNKNVIDDTGSSASKTLLETYDIRAHKVINESFFATYIINFALLFIVYSLIK